MRFCILVAGAAAAASLPRYNVESYCRQVAQVSGGSSMIYNGCIDMEQTAYNGLRGRWAAVPGRSQNYCDQVGRVSGGSYSILEGRIEMEVGASSAPSQFKF